MKKILLWAGDSYIARALNQRPSLQVTTWISSGYNEISLDIFDLYKGTFDDPPYDGHVAKFRDMVTTDNITTFIDMYTRHHFICFKLQDPSEYVNIFHRFVNLFHHVLKQNEIDIVIFNNLPHEGTDYVLYLMASALKIPTISLYQSLFPGKFFYFWKSESFTDFVHKKQLFPLENVRIEKRHEKDHFYMKNLGVNNYTLRKAINALLRRRDWSGFWRWTLSKKYQVNLNNAEKSSQTTEPFVYFPLHLQPELTTSALGGKYSDQLLALEDLHEFIPDNWRIMVKENPKQTELMRGHSFFKRLLSLKKVLLVPRNTNTFELISKCEFVATVTGTAGWEAITGGKKVLAFGDAWYCDLPGAFRYSHDIQLQTILNYEIDHEKLENAVAGLQSKMGRGITDLDYSSQVEFFDPVKNATDIAKFVEDLIIEKSTPT